jgi:L-ribulokinase
MPRNVPLALDPQWSKNLAAQCWLWKDHTSYREAAEITRSPRASPQYIAKCGNTYSSEWFWSRSGIASRPRPTSSRPPIAGSSSRLHSIGARGRDRSAPGQARRLRAGHKALYSDEWGGLPDKEFLALLDPAWRRFARPPLRPGARRDRSAGSLCAEWAEKLGLPAGIPIAIGEFDVHYGAIGSGIEEGVLVKAIGTSTCDCAVVDADKKIADIPGICGIVKGAILPGFYGIEAGQSAVGDIFKWWVEVVCEGDAAVHAQAGRGSRRGAKPGQSGLLALDWNNGNRTILVDPLLTGLLVGQTLYTTRAEIYRA